MSGGTTGMSAEQVMYYAAHVIRMHTNGQNINMSRPAREKQVRDYAVPLSMVRDMLRTAP